MKILHLISQLPEQTGSGIYIQAMIRHARSRGCENALLAGSPAGKPLVQIPFDDHELVSFNGDDISFPIVGMSDVMPYFSRIFRSLTPHELKVYLSAFEQKINAVISRFKPDIIHSHHLWLMTAQTRRLFPHLPIVATCHGSDLRQFVSCPNLQDHIIDSCRDLDTVMALSEAQKSEIIHLYGIEKSRITVIGAGYNDSIFTPGSPSFKDRIIISYAGKLSRAKGVIYLLKALEQLTSLPWHLNLVGDGSGPEKAEILEFIEPMRNRITWHGMQPQNELADILKNSHIFILPSFFEGLPLVLLEALASHCKIITTALPGTLEIFRDRLCREVTLIPLPPMRSIDTPEPGSETTFISDLIQALKSQIRACADNTEFDAQTISGLLEKYTWKGIFEQVFSVYNQWVTP